MWKKKNSQLCRPARIRIRRGKSSRADTAVRIGKEESNKVATAVLFVFVIVNCNCRKAIYCPIVILIFLIVATGVTVTIIVTIQIVSSELFISKQMLLLELELETRPTADTKEMSSFVFTSLEKKKRPVKWSTKSNQRELVRAPKNTRSCGYPYDTCSNYLHQLIQVPVQ